MKPPGPVTKTSSDFMIPPRSNCRRPRLRHAPAKSVYQFRRKLRPRPSQAVLRWLVYAQFPRSSSGNSDHTGRTFDCDPGTERCGLLLQGLQNSAGIGCVGQIRNTAPRRFVRIAHVERVELHGFGFGNRRNRLRPRPRHTGCGSNSGHYVRLLREQPPGVGEVLIR